MEPHEIKLTPRQKDALDVMASSDMWKHSDGIWRSDPWSSTRFNTKTMLALEDRHLIKLVFHGRYTITDAGREWLEANG